MGLRVGLKAGFAVLSGIGWDWMGLRRNEGWYWPGDLGAELWGLVLGR